MFDTDWWAIWWPEVWGISGFFPGWIMILASASVIEDKRQNSERVVWLLLICGTIIGGPGIWCIMSPFWVIAAACGIASGFYILFTRPRLVYLSVKRLYRRFNQVPWSNTAT